VGITVGIVLLAQKAPSFAQKPPMPVFTNPTAITNPYLPLASLNQDILEGTEGGQAVRVERTRKVGTKTFTVNGQPVAALIMEDREFAGGALKEVTLDYFAQSDDGTVYYLGEDVDIYKNGQVVSHEGAWLYGVHTQTLGILMPAQPKVGDKFQSENVPGITQEDDEVLSVSETVTVPAGTYTNCLKMKEKLSDGGIDYKYFAPNVGVVKEVPEDGEVNLISHR
jgi:uncharacterized Zn-binding protein involved in type VI secretion